MSDRALLEQLFAFLCLRTFIAGDEKSVRDMVQRYPNPPLTLHNRVAMQMSIAEYKAFSALLVRIQTYLQPEPTQIAEKGAGDVFYATLDDH